MSNRSTVNDLTYLEVVDKIAELNEHIQSFWSKSQGWAPIDATNLLSKSRLDWLVSLSHSLYKWKDTPSENSFQDYLILAWANLGALVEGSMKFFLSVYYDDYKVDEHALIQCGKQIKPDGAIPDIEMLELILHALDSDLSTFFAADFQDMPEDLIQLIATVKTLSPEARIKLNEFLTLIMEETT